MESVPGISLALPPLAVYPSQDVIGKIPLKDWMIFLDSWIRSIEYRLRLPAEQFSNFKFSQNASGVPFLVSYLRQYALRTEPIESGSHEAKLHHCCYFLLKRLLLTTSVPFDCASAELVTLLGDGSFAFQVIADWKTTLKETWKRNEAQFKTAVETQKALLIREASYSHHMLALEQITALVRCVPEIAVVAIAGSDYLETIMYLYGKSETKVQKAIIENIYYSLRCLMNDAHKRISMLLDIVFELKSVADQVQLTNPNQVTLLSGLLCTTPFLRHFVADVGSGKRGQNLVQVLTSYKQANAHLHPITANHPSRRSKGKGKVPVKESDELHVHKAAQISQVHDLFPDLPNGYILRLLDHFHDSVEMTVAGLLEPTSLPADLQAPTNHDRLPLEATDGPVDLAPHSTPPFLPRRKNVFDNDEFDKLQISSSRVHRGRREISDQPQGNDDKAKSKAAILAALAAFDADDDERDDTYDVADVGGAVDSTLDSDEKRDNDYATRVEETLFRTWVANPELFARDSKTRLSNARRQLRDDTNMGDEQIEGWNIMLSRDSKQEDRLRQKYSVTRTFRGNQHTIASTRWRVDGDSSDSGEEGRHNNNDGRRIGAAGIRGTRNWNAGRGRGSTSGNPNDHSTQMARKRKGQGRTRGGANQRKDGRAKKLGRGMGPVAQ